MVSLRAVTVVVLALVLGGGSTAHGESTEPVLGKANLAPSSIGWGAAHPRIIFNGGVPSGRPWSLRWSSWGGGSATARGLTWLYRPTGGYYGKPGAIELRAYRLGQCVAGGPSAYTRLVARVAARPGGALGKWVAWGGWHSICRIG
jgi:hypothetical protein